MSDRESDRESERGTWRLEALLVLTALIIGALLLLGEEHVLRDLASRAAAIVR
jgi:hypothetical protein